MFMSKLSEAKNHISVKVDMNEMDLTAAESKATYEEIQEWVQEKYGFHVSHLNIAKTKQKCGIIERENYNKAKNKDSRVPNCPKTKEKAITDALIHFKMIQNSALLNIKLGNIDKHLSSMMGQLSKDLALVYGTSIYNLQKTLDLFNEHQADKLIILGDTFGTDAEEMVELLNGISRKLTIVNEETSIKNIHTMK